VAANPAAQSGAPVLGLPSYLGLPARRGAGAGEQEGEECDGVLINPSAVTRCQLRPSCPPSCLVMPAYQRPSAYGFRTSAVWCAQFAGAVDIGI